MYLYVICENINSLESQQFCSVQNKARVPLRYIIIDTKIIPVGAPASRAGLRETTPHGSRRAFTHAASLKLQFGDVGKFQIGLFADPK